MKKTPLRSEIANEDKWKIEDLYRTDESWESDYNKCLEIAKTDCEYKGRLSESADNFYNALKESDDVDYLIERVNVYAFMKYYEDTANPKYQDLSGKAQMAAVKLSEKYSFMMPEILSMDEKVIEDFLKDERIAMYRNAISDILVKKEHSLSEKEERLLAMAGQMSSSPNEIFSKFNNADARFGFIKDEDGNMVELTNGKYSVFMESNDRRVRMDAFKALYKEYGDYINTLSAVYYANVRQAVFFAQARKYSSTLEMYLSGSFIPVSVYKNLIATVNKNLDKMHRYVSLRKRELGGDELHFYDIYAPMVSDYKLKVTYDEAKKIAIKALAPLGKEYTDKLQEGFDTGWVDVRENAGKRNGAFSWGAYGTHPYVFLNYSDTLNDVFTLVHEMGHAMHTFYSNSNQPYVYAGYKIFVAEVASTCNEAILIRYLLDNCKDKQEKKYLINHYLEQFKGTLFRQTMFAEFEMITHDMAEKGEVLSAENMCNIYKELNKKYFGEDMFIDDEISIEWARIPHFYTPFYVYQYATGFSAAVAIASGIIAGDKNVLDGYKKFLSGGCKLHPIELLKLCGIDMSKPEVIQETLDVFGELIDEYER